MGRVEKKISLINKSVSFLLIPQVFINEICFSSIIASLLVKQYAVNYKYPFFLFLVTINTLIYEQETDYFGWPDPYQLVWPVLDWAYSSVGFPKKKKK